MGGVIIGRWAGITECLCTCVRTLTPLTTGDADEEDRMLGEEGGGGVLVLFLARCGDACSVWAGLGASADGGLSDCTRPLAALLSMARA